MSARAVYDTIGRGYTRQRRPDPRIAARLTAALGGARPVFNVGADAGSLAAHRLRRSRTTPSSFCDYALP